MSAAPGPELPDLPADPEAGHRRGEEPLLRGGIVGILSVALATLALAAAGALVAFVVAVLS